MSDEAKNKKEHSQDWLCHQESSRGKRAMEKTGLCHSTNTAQTQDWLCHPTNSEQSQGSSRRRRAMESC